MRQVKVSLRRTVDDSYRVLVEPGLLARLPELLAARYGARRAVLIADTTTRRLFGRALARSMRASGIPVLELTFPAGERSKTRRTKETLEDAMLAAGVDRTGYVVAVGGGVVGDIAGYVASTYLRGIPFVQVPTTLLAQVDSSVGGKTGVDTPHGKNLVGTFAQPALVAIDPATLASLPAEQFLSGMGEVVKHALLFDRRLADTLEARRAAILARDLSILSPVIARNVALKGRVVEKDEREAELRKTLNYGHTVAHALELAADFKVPHGIAVLVGLVAEAAIAALAGIVPEALARELAARVLPWLPAARRSLGRDPARLVPLMRGDKKNRAGRIHFTVPDRVGRPWKRAGKYAFAVDEETIRAGLAFYAELAR